MSDGLIVPKQTEYVIARPPRRRLPLAAVLSLAVVAVVAGAVFVVRHYREPHKYPVLQLPAVGLKAALRTKWVNGSGRYIFQVKPTPGNEARFVSVLQMVPHEQLEFDIHLLDSDGFEVCSAVVPTMHILREPDGKASGMKADQALSSCTEEQMRAASRWHVTYRFPLLGADISPPQAVLVAPDANQNALLTGADFSTGEVETLNAGSFKVLKSAEYMTLMGWRSPDAISFLCKGPVCVLTNLRTSESVHARKR